MIPSTEFLLRVALFETVSFLILGSVLLCRRFSDQPLERIRMTQIGFAAVLIALFLTVTSILPGQLFISPSNPTVSAMTVLEPEILKTEFEIAAGIPEEKILEYRPHQLPLRETSLTEAAEIESPLQVVEKSPITPTIAVLPVADSTPLKTVAPKVFVGTRFPVEMIVPALLCVSPLFLLLLNFAAKLRLLWILRRSETSPDFIRNMFEKIRGASKRHVEIRISRDIDTPQVFGLLRPVLLLPLWLCEESSHDNRALRACLAHEWSHLCHGDLLTWNFVRLFQYPLWMQPFYWMLCTRLLDDQDFLADDEGARCLEDPADYANVLLELARSRCPALSSGVLGMAGRKSQLKRRIEMIFDDERKVSQKPRKCKLLLPVVLVAVLTLLGGTIRFGEKTVAEETPKPGVPVQKIENEATQEKPVIDMDVPEMQPLSMTKAKNEFEISGNVYDTNGKPVSGIEVCSYEDERTEASAPAITDENGSFVLKGKKAFGIQARSPDGRSFFLHIISGDQLPVAQLQPARKLTGQIVDKDGKPVAGATVGMYTHRRRNYFAESDSEGRFTIYYPQNAPAILSIFAFKSKAGFDYRLFGSEDGVLDANQPNVDWSKPFTLTLTGAEPIRLNVRWNDGSPATGVTVTPWTFQNPNHPRMQASPAFGDSFNFAFLQYFNRKKVDADGIVEFDWMPDWLDRITFFYILGPWEGDEVLKRIEVNFKPPTNDLHEKTVVLHRPLKASGVVRFPDGKPAEGITVKCEGVTLNYDYKRFSAKTDANGRYEIAIDPEAAYVLGVENADWGAMPVNPLVVNAKTKPEELQNLDFTLRKTVRVHGNVVFGPDRQQLKGLKIYFAVSGKTDLDLPLEKQLTPIEGRERRRGDEEGCGGPDLNYSLLFGDAAIDDNGNWTKQLGPGEYSFSINENYIGKPGFVRRLLPDDAKIIVPEDAGEEIVLNLEAKGSGNGRLRGKVLLADGTPAVGAKLVGAFHSNGRTIDSLTPDFKAETDAEGNFDGARTLEPVWLFVKSADGSQQALLSLDENTQMLDEPIRLQQPGSVTGRVVDFHGNAIPDIEIFYGIPVYGLFGYDEWHDKHRNFPPRLRSQLRFGSSVKADKDGIFAIDSIVVGEDCYITYAAPQKEQLNGNDKFQIAKVRLENSNAKLDLGDCRVNPASMEGWKAPEPDTLPKFTVRFLDDKTEKPITNQKIDIGWARIQTEKESKKTGPDGVKRFPPEENRPFTGEYPITDENGKIEFSLPVQASVYDPNEIELQVSCFRSLPGGSSPEAWNKIPYVTLYETISGPFTENRDLAFRLIPYPTVTGKIVDPGGKPVVGASLRLMTSRRPKAEDAKLIFAHKEFDTTTDADGVFRSMIAPEFDNGTMQCNAQGFVPSQIDLKDRNPDKPEDWVFTVQKGVDVSGRLIDTDGKGIAGLWVNFQRSSYGTVNDPLGRSIKTDTEGRFVASSLDKEEYRVNITPIPCCPNAENVEQVPRYDIPPTNEKFVFSNVSIDLRVKEGEEPKKREPLNIIGYPTVPFNFTVTDETNNGGALNYSRFAFHGQLSDAQEIWSVQAKPTQEPRDRKRASGVSQLPKGSSVSLSGTLYGYVVKDGVGNILDEKQNWTLEYRFSGDTEWKTATESIVSGDSIAQHVSGRIGTVENENRTLEIRIR